MEVYHLPYDPDYPVVCMDESSKQMVGEVYDPIPCKPGQPKRMDDEYVRKGVAEIFMEVNLWLANVMSRSLSAAPERTGRNKSRECLMNATLMPFK